jgi:hypothetical protein
VTDQPRPARRSRPRRRRRWLARLLALAGAAVVFVAGVALGEALKDGPRTGVQTLIRTLRPLPLVPIVQTTVTVTTESPSP